MKSFVLAILVIVLLASNSDYGLAAAAPPPPETIPVCDSPACFIVVTPIAPPSGTDKDTIPVKYKTVWVSIPRNLESIGIGDTVASFGYGKNKIVMGILRNEDFTQPKSDLTVAERTEIIFTRTPKDREPVDKENKIAWRLTLLGKAAILEGARQVVRFNKNGFTFYVLSGAKGPYPIDAYVVDEDAKDRVIILQGNMDMDNFLTVLGSIRKEK